jgi:hypothetical protein
VLQMQNSGSVGNWSRSGGSRCQELRIARKLDIARQPSGAVACRSSSGTAAMIATADTRSFRKFDCEVVKSLRFIG